MLKKWTAALLVACMLFTLPTPVSQASNETGAVPTVVDVSEEKVSEEATSDDVVIDDTVIDDADVSSEETTGEQDADIVEASADAEDSDVKDVDVENAGETVSGEVSENAKETVNTLSIDDTDTANPAKEENESSEETAARTGDALVSYILDQDTPEGLIEAIQSVTNEQLETLTEEQLEQLGTHINQVIPSVEISSVGDTVVAGDETVTGPSEIRKLTYDFTDAAPFGESAKGTSISRLRTYNAARTTLNTEPEDDGLETSKSFDFNSGSRTEGTITLEAWATGEYKQTTVDKEIPTDIILVLDQSGSMDDAFDTVTKNSYKKLNNNNMANYPLRQNGGSDNIWYKLDDGSFVRVNMTVEQDTGNIEWEVCKGSNPAFRDKLYNPDMIKWSDAGVLYQWLDDGTYARCYVKPSGTLIFGVSPSGYDYYYADGTTEHVALGDNPSQVSADRFFHATDVTNIYTYFYVDNEGHEKVIEHSSGDDTIPAKSYYSLVTTSEDRTKLMALQDAVREFTAAVAEKAKGADPESTEDDVNHRIAVVGFASGDSWNGRNYDYGNTEVFIGSQQNKYGNAAERVYTSAFMDMNDSNDVVKVKDSIDALDGDGGTLTNLGLEMANGIFEKNPITSGTERNRVVIVFTDGQPGWSGYDGTVAAKAVNQAAVSKTNYQATVYTVGIFEGANVNGTDKTNTFMRNMATSGEGYYLTASNSETLKNIFQKISDNIQTGGSKITLGSDTVVKDAMSDYFRLPDNVNSRDIKVYTADVDPKTGNFKDKEEFTDARITVDTTNQTVSVTNFDFSENWVGRRIVNEETTYGGKKLIIEIPCKVREGFLGGNDVPTNDWENSGVYDKDGKEVEKFADKNTSPKANVPIRNVTVTPKDKNIYLLGSLTDAQLKDDATVKVGDIALDLSKASDANPPYGLEPWQTDFVNIKVGIDYGTLNNLEEDSVYRISASVAPISDGSSAKGTPNSVEVETNRGAANINVFKPKLTFVDSQVYYGDEAPTSYEGNLSSTKWIHGETEAKDVTMTGTEPVLTMTYTPDASKIQDGKINTKQDVSVDVTVKIEDNDITAKTTFDHTDCSGTTCDLPKGKEFLLHVKTCSLTIKKRGGKEDEYFIFNVKKDNVPYMSIVVPAGDSVTIKELPVGTYTIEEDTSWSWRYKSSFSNKDNVVLSKSNPTDTVTCTNTPFNNKWLTDTAKEKNVYGVSKTTTKGGNN